MVPLFYKCQTLFHLNFSSIDLEGYSLGIVSGRNQVKQIQALVNKFTLCYIKSKNLDELKRKSESFPIFIKGILKTTEQSTKYFLTDQTQTRTLQLFNLEKAFDLRNKIHKMQLNDIKEEYCVCLCEDIIQKEEKQFQSFFPMYVGKSKEQIVEKLKRKLFWQVFLFIVIILIIYFICCKMKKQPADGNQNQPADGNQNQAADGNQNQPADGNQNQGQEVQHNQINNLQFTSEDQATQ